MFKNIFAAFASIAIAAGPAAAFVDAGTTDLIRTVDESDIVVSVGNPKYCDSGEYLGAYIHSGMRRWMALCPGAEVDGLDHAVVRHEVWHAVQHCVNVARGTSLTTPVNQDTQDLMADVFEHVPESIIKGVQDNYPREQWLLEFEANLIMVILSASEVEDAFQQACLAS